MFAYWLLFGFFALGALFARPDANPRKKLGTLIIAWLVLVLFIGLRGKVGQDWGSYLNWYLRAGRLSFESYMKAVYSDYVFYGTIWVLRNLYVPFWVTTFLFSTIFVTGLIRFCRTQVNPWLCAFVAVPYLIVVVSLSGTRQSTAIGFEFLSLVSLAREERNKCFFWQFLAALCHASAVVMLPVVALSFSKSRVQSIILFAILSLAALYILSSSIDSYVGRYVSTTRLLQSSGTPIRIGTNVLAAVVYLAYRKRIIASESAHLLWRNMSLIALVAIPLYFLIPSSTSLDRTLLYIFPLQMFALGWLPYVSGSPAHKTLAGAFLFVYLAAQLFVFLNFGTNAQGYIPYRITDFRI